MKRKKAEEASLTRFLAVHGASTLDDLDDRDLADLQAFLEQRAGRTREDAEETRGRGLRKTAAALSRMAAEVSECRARRAAALRA
jgi:hypothetical protein